MTRTALLLTLTALIALTAAPALAAKKASKSQTTAITKAIQATASGDFNEIPTKQYRITDAKISTKSKNWASARAVPNKGFEDSFQSAYFVLVQPGGTKEWVVVDGGTALVGCGIAPDSVLKDLGEACPTGEGLD